MPAAVGHLMNKYAPRSVEDILHDDALNLADPSFGTHDIHEAWQYFMPDENRVWPVRFCTFSIVLEVV